MKHFGRHDFPRLHTINARQSITVGEDADLDDDQYIPRFHHVVGSPLRNLRLKVFYFPSTGDPREYQRGRFVPITEQESQRPNVITPILLSLGSIPSKIRNLEIISNTLYPKFAEELFKVVCQLRHLATCVIEPLPIPPHALQHLASLPFLHKLNLTMHRVDYEAGLEPYLPRPDDPFPALQDLFLCADDSGCGFDDFIHSMRSTQLQKLHIRIENHVSRDSIGTLLSALATHPSATSLARFRLELGELYLLPSETHELPKSPEFLHLSSLSVLEDVDISGMYFGGLDDETLQAVVCSCPNLRQLRLYPGWKQRRDWTYNSLTTLETVLERCLHLDYLDLPLDIKSDEVKRAQRRTETNPFCRPQFQTLWAGHGSICCASDVCSIAALLSLWAPQLRGIKFELGGDPNWTRVHRLLKPFELVRRQERRWFDEWREV